MTSFGHSLPGKYIYDYFGFNVEGMTKKIETFVGDWKARPADSEEVAGAWESAVGYKEGPSMISVSRHALPQTGLTKREGVKKGAYVVEEEQDAEVT